MGQQDRRQGDGTGEQRPSAGRLAAGAGLALGATLATTGTAQATDFPVTNLDASGPGSLRDAIDQANAAVGPDRVLFQSGLSGTIHLNEPVQTGRLYVTEALEILGPGADQLTVSADAQSRVFYVDTADGDDVTISGLKIIQGSVKYTSAPGGNIASRGADLTVADSVVRSGNAILGGGGISSSGDLTLRDSTVSGNTANIIGGGILAGYGEDAVTRISGSTINNNAATGKYFGSPAPPPTEAQTDATEPTQREGGGGGIFVGGDTIIENSTFTGNAAAGQGGAILAKYGTDAAPAVRSTTISGNSAGSGGGIYSYLYRPNGTTEHPHVVLENSIVAGNEADGLANGPDLAGGPFDTAFSLIQTPSSVTINETVPGSNIFGLDPLLAALGENGGPTRTMALLPASPATDNGRTPTGETTDQRGEPRPSDLGTFPNSPAAGSDGADIGAYERQAPPPPTGSCNGQAATISGTNQRDILNGTEGRDVIVGFGGNDALRGFGGNDLICAGGGLDQVTGGDGADRIVGEGGNDRLYGQRGNDRITDTAGADLLSGGIDNDTLRGGGNEDRVLGAAGNDRLFGQAADDVVLGAKGNDFIRGGPGNDRLSGGVGVNDVQQ